MEKTTIQQVANQLTKRHNITQAEAESFANAMFTLIREALQRDGTAKVKGLGTFKLTTLPQGRTKVAFNPEPTMRDMVNKPFAQFQTVALNDGVDFEQTNQQPQQTETKQEENPQPSEPKQEEKPKHKPNTNTRQEQKTKSHAAKWAAMVAVTLALTAAAAFAGYQYGLTQATQQLAQSQAQPAAKPAPKPTPKPQKPKPTAHDTTANSKPRQSSNATLPPEDYEKADPRVRTGAYQIVGIDRIVIAKATDNIKNISRSALGPGMECYVEAINGMKANDKLKEGQQIKIPKLKLKK